MNLFMWTYSSTGAAEACGGAVGTAQIHDPPLIFDLQRDKAEETPLDSRTPEYWALVEQITRRREELLWDIATDKSVSTANYNTDETAMPCCDPQQAVCRCDTWGWRWRPFPRPWDFSYIVPSWVFVDFDEELKPKANKYRNRQRNFFKL